MSQLMTELCAQLRIEQNTSTAYHPRTDRQSERTNQWLEQYLRFWVNHHQDDWYYFLPMAKFAHNSWHNEITKMTLYQTLMGYNPVADWRPINATVPAPVTCLEQWKMARETAYAQMRKAQEHWAQAKKDGRKFRQGDLIWLKGCNLKMDRPSVKLAAKRYGPFLVAQELSPMTLSKKESHLKVIDFLLTSSSVFWLVKVKERSLKSHLKVWQKSRKSHWLPLDFKQCFLTVKVKERSLKSHWKVWQKSRKSHWLLLTSCSFFWLSKSKKSQLKVCHIMSQSHKIQA